MVDAGGGRIVKQKRFLKQLRAWLSKNSMTWAKKDTDRAAWHFRCQLQALLALKHDDKAPKGYEEFKIIMEKLIIDRGDDGDDEPDEPDDMPALIPNGQETDSDADMPPGPSPSRTAVAHSTASPASSRDAGQISTSLKRNSSQAAPAQTEKV